MFVNPDPFVRISIVGDTALLIEFEQKISPDINAKVYALDRKMKENPLSGVIEWVPAFSSLLIVYDPLKVKTSEVKPWLYDCLNNLSSGKMGSTKEIQIPVHYGGANGPDLQFVAENHHKTTKEVIRCHTSPTYRVGMMGFTPGFAYLMGMNPALATPRLATPRSNVPAGSVGIAGEQTGVYPMESPGGWQLIGRTHIKLFDPDCPPYFLLSPGDSVRFIAIDEIGSAQ